MTSNATPGLFEPAPAWPYAAAPGSLSQPDGAPHRRCRDCSACHREPSDDEVVYFVCRTAEADAGRPVGEINPFSPACARFELRGGGR